MDQFIGTQVTITQTDFEKNRGVPAQAGKVLSVQFTAFEDSGGCVNERIQVIVGLDNGTFKAYPLNRLKAAS